MLQTVNLAQKFSLIQDYWRPRIAGELNGSFLKLVRLRGEFIWHRHENEDELFLVVSGSLRILLRDGELRLAAGEFAIIPRGVEHCPVAEQDVEVALLEPKSTRNTGDLTNERTVEAQWI